MPATIRVTADTTKISAALHAIEKQLPYATARAGETQPKSKGKQCRLGPQFTARPDYLRRQRPRRYASRGEAPPHRAATIVTGVAFAR